jgi:hypothetical protein
MIRFHKGIMKKMWGNSTLASLPSSERAMELYYYQQYDSDEYLICCGIDHAYKLYTGAWTKISTAGPVFTGDSSNIFHSTTFNNLYLVTNGKDVVQKWDGSTWADMTGSIICKVMVPFYSRLVVGNTIESGTAYPSRLRWSIIGTSETWTGTGSGAIDMLDTQDAITALCILGDKLFIFKEESIWECYYVGGTDIFRVRKVIDKIGTVASKSVINVGSFIIFYGNDDIYVFDGVQAVPVGTNMSPYLYETSDRVVSNTYLYKAISVYDSETNEYIVALPTLDNSEPNLLIFYNLNNKVFSKRILVCSCLGLYKDKAGSVIWSAATSAWNGGAWGIPWRQGYLPQGLPTVLYGGITGVVTREDKIVKSSELLTWESKDFVVSHNSRFVEFRYLAKGSPFSVAYSYDSGVNWTDDVTLTPSTTELAEVIHYVNISKFKVRIRIRTYGTDFEMIWIEPWYISRARSI